MSSQTPSPQDSSTQSSSSTTPHVLPEGYTIAERYRVDRSIGEGGMGSVYRAKHIAMGHLVAIKVLHKELVRDEEFALRFQREAQAASAIKHPNICAATDFGALPDGSPFMVMEYLEGETLEQLMQREVIVPVKETLRVAKQITSVLHEAHQQGIIHRDLKPENIMLVTRAGELGVVKVMDFGIASIQEGERLAPETRITRAGIAYGTPAYMSPEQVAGHTDIDGRADLYSLGIILFEMLTGTYPFEGNNVAAIMAQHLTTQPPSLCARTPSANIPPMLDHLVLQLLAKTPEDRPANASVVQQQLNDILVMLEPGAGASASMTLAATSINTGVAQASPYQFVQKHQKTLLIVVPAFVALLFVSLIVIVYALSTPSDPLLSKPIEVDDSSPPEEIKLSVEQSRQRFVASTTGMNDLVVKMAAGQQQEALDALLAREEELKDSAHYHYYIGLAMDGLSQEIKALEHYLKAIDMDKRYMEDPQIAANLAKLAVSSKKDDEEAFATAHASIPSLFRIVQPALATLAMDPDARRKDRKKAYDLLKEKEALSTLQPWEQAAISLENESGCEHRSEAIKKLAETKNDKVHKILLRWDDKPKTGCSGRTLRSKIAKDKDCYACIRDDLAAALEQFPKKDEKTQDP